MGAGNPEVDQQLRDRFRDHRTAAVGVQAELVGLDVVLDAGGLDQVCGQLSVLGFGDRPGHHVPREDVDDHVQVVVDATVGTAQFGDVPRPTLVGAGRLQLGFGLGRVGGLPATFAGFALFAQNAVPVS